MANQHAAPAAAPDALIIPEPTHAERARTLLHLSRVGTLSTLSRKQEGFPFGSLMPYALDPQGRPLFLISSMAMHTQNLRTDPRASLLVTQQAAEGDVLGAARATLVGRVMLVPDADRPSSRALYLDRQPSSSYWVDFDDFHFFRLEPLDIYYVGGFGVMGWITATDYTEATPDPLADAGPGILAHMNADHGDALLLLTRTLAQSEDLRAAETVTMTAVDRLGFHIAAKTPAGMKGTRIPFLREVATPEQTRAVMVEMVRGARTR